MTIIKIKGKEKRNETKLKDKRHLEKGENVLKVSSQEQLAGSEFCMFAPLLPFSRRVAKSRLAADKNELEARPRGCNVQTILVFAKPDA